MSGFIWKKRSEKAFEIAKKPLRRHQYRRKTIPFWPPILTEKPDSTRKFELLQGQNAGQPNVNKPYFPAFFSCFLIGAAFLVFLLHHPGDPSTDDSACRFLVPKILLTVHRSSARRIWIPFFLLQIATRLSSSRLDYDSRFRNSFCKYFSHILIFWFLSEKNLHDESPLLDSFNLSFTLDTHAAYRTAGCSISQTSPDTRSQSSPLSVLLSHHLVFILATQPSSKFPSVDNPQDDCYESLPICQASQTALSALADSPNRCQQLPHPNSSSLGSAFTNFSAGPHRIS